MQFQAIDNNRETEQVSLRFFKDQLEAMLWLCQAKYRGRINRSDLVRSYVDQGIERDTRRPHGSE